MNIYEILRQNNLFSDLSDTDLNQLLSISSTIRVPKGNSFIKEGEVAENFYCILSGEVIITKTDKEGKEKHTIAQLKSGNTVGEMALLDHKPRSASAETVTESTLLCIPFQPLKKLARESGSFNQIFFNMTENISERMRQTNSVVVKALNEQLHEFKIRTALGVFMTNVIITLCLFSFALSWLIHQESGAVSSTVITLPLTICFLILFFSIIKSSKLPLRTFGLTTQNWRKAVIESICFTALLCLLIELVKWILIHTSQKYSGHPVFEPYLTLNLNEGSSRFSKNETWILVLLSYWLIITPLQELIVRGGLQSPLEVFLTGKNTVFKSIVISNIMFSTAHLFMGIDISLVVFFAGLYLGWLYSRHKTLIGVIIAHGILGTWALMVVGF